MTETAPVERMPWAIPPGALAEWLRLSAVHRAVPDGHRGVVAGAKERPQVTRVATSPQRAGGALDRGGSAWPAAVTSLAMDASQLASRSLLLRWQRPRYALLDQRGSLLELLDEDDKVDAYATAEGSVDVRMRGGIALHVNTLGAWAYELVVPSDRRGRSMIDLVQAVGERLGVTDVTVTAAFQHLVPWDGETDESRASRTATASILGDPEWYDFALLVDGFSRSMWSYQAEFGVLSAADAPARLARRIGRMSDTAAPPLEEEIVSGDYPAVATFVDSTWRRPQEHTLVDVDEVLSVVEEEANDLARRCHERARVPQNS